MRFAQPPGLRNRYVLLVVLFVCLVFVVVVLYLFDQRAQHVHPAFFEAMLSKTAIQGNLCNPRPGQISKQSCIFFIKKNRGMGLRNSESARKTVFNDILKLFFIEISFLFVMFFFFF